MTGGSKRGVTILAPAKVNLFLHVLNRQPGGDHRVMTLMQMIGLYDRIHIDKLPVKGQIRLSVSGLSVSQGMDNLVMRAAKAFLKSYQIRGGVRITLHKGIPIAAGLGGGSSDAAGTLIALARLWRIRPSRSELITLARFLGSDVPFFLCGPAALVQGTGEEVHPVRPVGKGWLVLIKKGSKRSTAWAYRRLDRVRSKQAFRAVPRGVKFWLTSLKKQNNINRQSRLTFQLEKLPKYLHNDLEDVTESAYPDVAKIKECLVRLGAVGVLMAGSGPTVFGLFHEEGLANRVGRALSRDHSDWEIRVAKLLERNPMIIRRSSNGRTSAFGAENWGSSPYLRTEF